MTDQDGADSVPMRRCFVCRESLPKTEMLRLASDAGQLWPDLLQQAPGRGVYHCMRESCLTGMNDRRLRSLKPRLEDACLHWSELRQRMEAGLERQLQLMFSRLRIKAAIGRDAVMHRLWSNAPLFLLLAEDAGSAIARQVEDAVEKRRQAGQATLLARVPAAGWLGGMLGRERVAIAGFDATAMTEKMNQYCVWYGRIKVLG